MYKGIIYVNTDMISVSFVALRLKYRNAWKFETIAKSMRDSEI